MRPAPSLVAVSEEVAAALAAGRPVVALESTIVTHGLPWPDNLAAARLAEAAVRRQGAVPATVAVHAGRLRVGLAEAELEALARADRPAKVSRQDLAAALGREGWAGTTVSATMIAAHRAGIALFATGGIGGVHRGGHDSLDISADLDELARTPVAVVCAGPKSMLDVGRTLEVLETRGVPVVGWRTGRLAGFYSRDGGHDVPISVSGPEEAAALIARHEALALGSGMLFAVPLPEGVALPRDELEVLTERATAEAEAAGVHGPRSTPWILARLAELSGGRTVRANLALIEQDAAVAASIAAARASRAGV